MAFACGCQVLRSERYLTYAGLCGTLMMVEESDQCRLKLEGRYMLMKKNRDLEVLIERIDNNVANNYKDAAQDYLKQYETKLRELLEKNTLKDRQKAHYESLLDNYKEQLKEFRHKDQKPYWT